MICGKCNYDNPEGSTFCQQCGEPLTAAQNTGYTNYAAGTGAAGVASKLPFKLDKKMIIGAVAAVAAVILLIIIISSIASGGSDYLSASKDYLGYFYNSDDDETHFTVGSKVTKDKLEGDIDGSAINYDGSVAVISVSEDDTTTIYSLTKSGLKKIAEDVGRYGISFDGSHAWYIDSDDTLYTYDIKKSKSEKISDDCTGGVVLSPDGKTVLFVVSSDADDEDEDEDEEGSDSGYETELRYWKGGKSEKIAKNYTAVSVSNNGKYVYIKNDEGSLYATKLGSDDKNKIASDLAGSVVANCDGSEVFFISDGKGYLSVKGGEKAKVGNMYSVNTLLPIDGGSQVGVYQPVKTFVGIAIAYRKDGGSDLALGFFKKAGSEYELTRVANDISYPRTVDGKEIYYIKSDELCRIKLKKDAEAEELAEDIESFSLTASGKIAYALDSDDTLWKVNGKKKDKVADDVESGYYCAFGDGVLYMTDYSTKNEEGTLNYSSNGKNKTKITDEATYVSALTASKIAVYMNSDGQAFISGNGKSFKEVK